MHSCRYQEKEYVCFTKANEIFKSLSKIACETNSHPVIEQEDLERNATFFFMTSDGSI